MRKDFILDIKDLHVSYKVYGGKLQVLDGINLSVAKGEKVGLVGETGCGKTTALKTIMRILPSEGVVEHGQILYHDNDILKMNMQELQICRRKGIGMIFQDPSTALNPVFRIEPQFRVGLKYTYLGDPHMKKKSDLKSRALKALADVHLADAERIIQMYPFQLSGGMKQRVCIAEAISTDRAVLLADEPGTSLDVTIQDQILRLIQDLVDQKSVSVILVTHSLGVVRQTTDYVYIMYAGTIVESGETKKVFSTPLHPYTDALMKCVPKLTGEGIAEGIPGRIPDYFNPPQGCRFAPRCPEAIDACHEVKPVLSEVGENHMVACHRKRM